MAICHDESLRANFLQDSEAIHRSTATFFSELCSKHGTMCVERDISDVSKRTRLFGVCVPFWTNLTRMLRWLWLAPVVLLLRG